MKKLLLLTLAILCFSTVATAQKSKKMGTIEGVVLNEETKETMPTALVQLYSLPDSTYKAGASVDTSGRFSLRSQAGKYYVKISYVGTVTQHKNIEITAGKTLNMGEILLAEDRVMLEGAVVTTEVPPVVVSEDTTVFNTAAYKVPPGSMLEELIRKYPGVEIADDGTITVNGKKVNRILLQGKDFFGTDKELALKNVPVDAVDKVKSYDKKSDFSRVTGIDDGEEETVLDLQMKKDLTQGLFSNVDAAYGTKERYALSSFLNYFTEKQRYSVILGANNTGGRGFGGRGGGSGLNANKNAALSFITGNDTVEFGGNVTARHSDSDNKSFTSRENFLTSGYGNQFSTSRNNSFGRSSSISANFRFEWKPDTMTSIIFTPSLSYSTSDNWSKSASATFDADPFEHDYEYEMSQFGDVTDSLTSIAINSNANESMSNSESKSFNGNLQLNRRLAKPGRNATLRGGFSYSTGENNSISTNTVKYFREAAGSRGYDRKRYNTTPNTNWSYNVGASYTEPLMKNLFLQFNYRFNYSYQNSDRSTFIFDDIANYAPILNHEYHMPALPELYEQYLSDSLSRASNYRNMNHDVQVGLRYITDNINLNVGVTWLPQTSEMSYKYFGLDTILKRTVYNISPNLRFRYRWSKQTDLNINYRGSTSQPSMTDLLDVTDDSNPLYITKGNPGLKPSFNNNLNVNFRTYNAESMRTISASLRYSNTLNSISRKVTYNAETGGQITQPDNINGNWNANGDFSYNSSIPQNTKFRYSSSTGGGYQHNVSYISMQRNANSVRNTVETYNVNERLSFGYNGDVLDFTLNGRINYSTSKNEQQPERNLETYNFSYGPDINVRVPWQNLQFSTNISMSSRRGYSDPDFNTDELLWNAQVSMSFLERNALSVMFQMYDILHQQSNVSRTINALMRSDTQTNAINNYCLLHVVYKFNQLGDKEMRESLRGYQNYGGREGRGFGGGRGGHF